MLALRRKLDQREVSKYDGEWPIRGQYSVHMIYIDQSEASILKSWGAHLGRQGSGWDFSGVSDTVISMSSWKVTNQRRVSLSRYLYWPIRGEYCDLIILVRGRWSGSRQFLGDLNIKKILQQSHVTLRDQFRPIRGQCTAVLRSHDMYWPIRGQYSRVLTCRVFGTKLRSCRWSWVLAAETRSALLGESFRENTRLVDRDIWE